MSEYFSTHSSSLCLSNLSHQLKILDYKPRNDASFDWNNLDFSFTNLTELLWDGTNQGRFFPLKLFALLPKLQKMKLNNVEINAEWQNKIPRSVKHILWDKIMFDDEPQCSLNYLCEDASVLETFYAKHCLIPKSVASTFFDGTPRLKKLELELMLDDGATSMVVNNALRNCRILETVKASGVNIAESWRRVIPGNVRSVDLFKMNVQETIRRDFSFGWLFQNYACLQSLQVTFGSWTGFDSQNFYSTQNLRKRYLDNCMSHFGPEFDGPIDPFPDICFRLIRGSHLVDVEICGMTMDESWKHIFPTTIKRLALNYIYLSKEAQLVFSPQFICENPSNVEELILSTFHDDLPAMDLKAFTGMQRLQKLHLKDLRLSGECLQSILTHCSALTKLFTQGLTAGALTHIPRNLILPSLRQLYVKESFDQPSLLLQYFPKVRSVDIAIVPPEASFSTIMNVLQVANTVEFKIRGLTLDLPRYLGESIDKTKYKYSCHSIVSVDSKELSFYWTNSLVDACRKLNGVFISEKDEDVLWIGNYPSSPLLRKIASNIPSS